MKQFAQYKPVVIESPFKASKFDPEHTEEVHRAYLERCIRDCIERGETPYGSHKMLTDALDDGDEDERAIGIKAGIDLAESLLKLGHKAVFYLDYGVSTGMHLAREKYREAGYHIESRTIGKNESHGD